MPEETKPEVITGTVHIETKLPDLLKLLKPEEPEEKEEE